MVEYVFGDVKVLADNNKKDAVIRFPSQMFKTVLEAENFMGHLIEGIIKAREIIGDPL